QGQYAYTISGIVPEDVYAVADQLMAKLQQFKGFASVRSDYYHDTPNLKIDINRDRAATYGVSTSAIQSLLRNAYSQNYVYLIKEPDDQYQVILEVKDKERAHPGDLDDLYVRSSTSGNFSASGSGGGTIATTTGNMTNLVPAIVPLSAFAFTRCRFHHVCDPGNPLRELCAPVHGFVSSNCARRSRRTGYIVSLPLSAFAL